MSETTKRDWAIKRGCWRGCQAMFGVSLNYAFIEVAAPGLKREMSTRAIFFLGGFFCCKKLNGTCTRVLP